MSRMKILNIKQLIDDYKEAKDSEASYKKQAEELNKSIKDYLINNGVDTESSDKWVAKITTSQKESLDEPKAIEILKSTLAPHLLQEVVKTKEYIDEDALEKLVYNGEFDVSTLAGCKLLSDPVVTLRITKKK